MRVHRSQLDAFVAAAKRKFAQYFPDYANNPDISHVFLEKQRRRLADVVEDAARRGVKVEVLGAEGKANLADDPARSRVLAEMKAAGMSLMPEGLSREEYLLDF